MAPNSPSCSFIHASMAGSRSTAPLNRSKSVLIVARLSASNRARVFKPVATPGAGTVEGTFPEDRASLLDSILHVSGVLERCQVGVEAACVAIWSATNPSNEMVIPTIAFANRSSVPDSADPSFQDYLQDQGRRKFSCISAA